MQRFGPFLCFVSHEIEYFQFWTRLKSHLGLWEPISGILLTEESNSWLHCPSKKSQSKHFFHLFKMPFSTTYPWYLGFCFSQGHCGLDGQLALARVSHTVTARWLMSAGSWHSGFHKSNLHLLVKMNAVNVNEETTMQSTWARALAI